MSGENVTALIVDDDLQSSNYLSKLMLHAAPEVEFVGRASNTREAFAAINELKPDIIFL
ncbi:MAG TPA: hypothetical protein VFU29_13785 [Chitinophagaceae bacterium]|nr:hypothetical protein [Chitinophagaceae bacterium]